MLDQVLGLGDGTKSSFALSKTYGGAHAPWQRRITKPVADTILVAVDGVAKSIGTDVVVDTVTGTLVFQPGHIPQAGHTVTAGFAFDVPVRFDTDRLEVNLQGFRHGAIPSIPLIEIRV
jgi:uncharacterized protein (TIGR02217 family)